MNPKTQQQLITMDKNPISDEQSAIVDAEVAASSTLIHQALARRLSRKEDALKESLIVITDAGVSVAAREEALRVLKASPAMNAISSALLQSPVDGHVWLLYLRTERGTVPELRQIRVDRARLSIKSAPSLEQEQLLDAFVDAANPQIMGLLTEYMERHPPQRLAAAGVAVYLHDTGPGIILVDKLREILTAHGFHSDADLLSTQPHDQHIWVWVSTWQGGGTVGLRQLCLAPKHRRVRYAC